MAGKHGHLPLLPAFKSGLIARPFLQARETQAVL
jgi:hypothetical protein